jgi:hypothetical protein
MARVSVEERPDVAARVLARAIQLNPQSYRWPLQIPDL